MRRTLITCVMFSVLATAWLPAQSVNDEGQQEGPDEISQLQERRLELLRERVSKFEEVRKIGLVRGVNAIDARFDLLNAELEYTQTKPQKRKLLDELLNEHDRLIEHFELEAQAPTRPPVPGRNPFEKHFFSSAEVLRLKAERIRIEILRQSL